MQFHKALSMILLVPGAGVGFLHSQVTELIQRHHAFFYVVFIQTTIRLELYRLLRMQWHVVRQSLDALQSSLLLFLGFGAVTVRYTSTNLESKRAEVEQLLSFRHKSVTIAPKCSSKIIELSQTQL
jgi:hypothetical protein